MSNTSIEAMSKKCIMLLRSAMRPNIFGNVVSLKSQWLVLILNNFLYFIKN